MSRDDLAVVLEMSSLLVAGFLIWCTVFVLGTGLFILVERL